MANDEKLLSRDIHPGAVVGAVQESEIFSVDYCVEISLGHPAANGASWSLGDFVAIYPAAQIGTFDGTEYIPKNIPVAMPMTGWVFIMGAPVKSLDLLNSRLCRALVDTTFGPPVITKKRKWYASISTIPIVIKNRLETNRYVTVTWAQVKNYIRNRFDESLLTDTEIA